MSNIFVSNNQHPPIPFRKLFAGRGGEPLLSKAEKTRVLALAAKEADFMARKNQYGRLPARGRVREAARLYASGDGPAPQQTPDQAAETAEIIVRQLRAARNTWFHTEARAFLIELFQRMVTRARGVGEEIAKRHQDEAEALGVPYLTPPVVRSAERAIWLLERDLEGLTSQPDHAFSLHHQFLPKVSLEPPQAADTAEPK